MVEADPIQREMSTSSVRVLADRYWEWRLKSSPEFATLIGHHVNDHQLDCHTLEAYARRKGEVEEFSRQIGNITEGDLMEDDWTNYMLLKKELDMYLSGMQFKGYLLCFNFMEDINVYFSRTINRMTFENEDDYEKLISRFNAFPEQMDSFINLLKQGIKEKMVHHVHCVVSVADNLKKLSESNPEDTTFYAPFQKMIEIPSISESRRTEIRQLGTQLIADKILKSFKKFVNFVNNEYLNHLRPDIGCTSLPNGKAYYEASLRLHITCDLTAEEVHNIGIREVKRIKEKMKEVMNQVGFSGDIKSFLGYLSKEKQFYFETKSELLNGYKELVRKVKPVLPKYFKNIPNMEMRIEEVSGNANVQTTAFYFGPSADGSNPGVFNVNCHDIHRRPKFEMMSLCLHEAEPGHHLQFSYSVLMDHLPGFRRFKDDRHYGIVPSRFSMHSGYIEGWGMYCEFLGEEMGMYEDPYSLFGRHFSEMLRACRLVVDTGVHAFGWSFEKGVEYIRENTSMPRERIEQEVQRYIALPGQACAYTIGELKIRELRTKCEAQLGQKFDLRDFHDAVLSCGPVPLTALEILIDKFIEKTLHH